MGIGVGPDAEALRASVRALLTRSCPPAVPREAVDAAREQRTWAPPPPLWRDLASSGLVGLAVPEEHGGQGASLLEVCVVLEELGRALAPVPYLSTVLAAALVVAAGEEALRKELLPGVAQGKAPCAVALGACDLRAQDVDRGHRLTGTADGCVDVAAAAWLLLPAGAADSGRWCLVPTDAVAVEPQPSLDGTRPLSRVTVDGVVVPSEHQLHLAPHTLAELCAVLLSAEACGVAAWCLDTTVAHARQRVQFGRPIGQFQAVKHRCADLLVGLEQARALAWDAGRAWPADVGEPPDDVRLAASTAASLCPEVAATAAKACIQVLGGIGYSWEHDAHLYLKRAVAVRQLVGGTRRWRCAVAGYAVAGARRALDVALPADAERYRAEVREFLEQVGPLTEPDRRHRLADEGYLAPHWPRPYGRDAGPLEQLVVDEEFRRARVRRPHLAVGAWALPTIIEYGTAEQQRRWVAPTLRGELTWCQMFSEPGAGSDLAALSTRATRVEGGWRVTGQKVWTSMAAWATHAILLARTGSGTAEDRRAGITYFVLDMRSEGTDVRPLRELTGDEFFNEVFLTDVFVPDSDVVGPVGGGWMLTRTTLANERVSMSTGATFGAGAERLLTAVAAMDPDAAVLTALGELLTEAQSLALLALRSTQRAVEGADAGPEASVRKLLGAEHEQRVQEFGLSLLGPAGASMEGPAQPWAAALLSTRCLTIAGGTSEIQRNVVAERLLGLPRDPEPGH